MGSFVNLSGTDPYSTCFYNYLLKTVSLEDKLALHPLRTGISAHPVEGHRKIILILETVFCINYK